MADGPTITNLREIERDGRTHYRFSWDAPFGSPAWQNGLDGVKCIPLEEREWDPIAKLWTVVVSDDNARLLALVFPNFQKALEAMHAQAALPL